MRIYYFPPAWSLARCFDWMDSHSIASDYGQCFMPYSEEDTEGNIVNGWSLEVWQ